MYGSSFRCCTSRPRFSRSAPMEAAASPLPSELTTPPVTNMNLVFLPRFTMPAPFLSPALGREDGPSALEVLRRVDAEPAVGGVGDPDAMPVLERPELLEGLLRLEAPGR